MTASNEKPKTIDEYIEASSMDSQEKLRELRACIREAAPGAIESLKWGMPAFSYKRILVTFAAFKHHIGFYPTPSAVEYFALDLLNYKTSKGSIQFPLKDPLPLLLIRKIVEFRVKESQEKDTKWKS